MAHEEGHLLVLCILLLSALTNADSKNISHDKEIFYCGEHGDRCTKNVHVCITGRCIKCKDYAWSCFTQHHIPNCTTFCKDVLENNIKKQLIGNRTEREKNLTESLLSTWQKNITDSESENCTSPEVNNAVGQCILWSVCVAIFSGLIVQAINICILAVFFQRRNRPLSLLKGLKVCRCKVTRQNVQDEQTGEKEPLGCDNNNPIQEVGDGLPINIHGQGPRLTEIPTSQNDEGQLVIGTAEGKEFI